MAWLHNTDSASTATIENSAIGLAAVTGFGKDVLSGDYDNIV
jgi:hypothetical protein